jgi:tRNA modification GTPase
MSAASSDTIVAIATPPGRGGIGVLRISGALVATIATSMCGELPAPRKAALRKFCDQHGEQIDSGLALYFPAPNSFTGEDVLELHGHGGPMVMDLLLACALQLGARLAQPGEFSQRAFLNDKLDLVQAEAIADLIDSGSQQAARAAVRSLQGEFSLRTQSLTEQLIEARMHVEAAIDFPEEEIDFLADTALRQRLDTLAAFVADTLANAQQGALLRDGMTVVIAGKPNAGKSSLLNALAGYDAAIVTPIPGTTRDVLRERIAIDGMPLHVIDTAGLRDTQDVVESEGIKRAHREMEKADRILYVIDSTQAVLDADLQRDLAALPSNVAVTLIYNKIDTVRPELVEGLLVSARNPSTSSGRTELEKNFKGRVAYNALALSAHTGRGLAELRHHLKDCMGLQDSSATTFSARRRHLDALRRAQSHVATAIELLNERKAGELMAEELRLAQQHIGEITGEFTSDDLLGKIFSSFCIGK